MKKRETGRDTTAYMKTEKEEKLTQSDEKRSGSE